MRDAAVSRTRQRHVVNTAGCGAVAVLRARECPGAQAVRPPARQSGADVTLWKSEVQRSLPAVTQRASQHSHASSDAAIPIEAGTDERGEEPNPVPLMRGCFQAARGHEADEIHSPGSAHNCPKKSGEIFASLSSAQRRFAEHTEGNLSQQPRNYSENPTNSESRIH